MSFRYRELTWRLKKTAFLFCVTDDLLQRHACGHAWESVDMRSDFKVVSLVIGKDIY